MLSEAAKSAASRPPRAGAREGSDVRTEIYLDQLAEPISHYTHAVVIDDLVFVSGLTATDTDHNVVGGEDAAAQTEVILTNLGRILQAAGSGIDLVCKVTVYLTDIDDRPRINPVRQRFFGDTRPASTLIEVSRLAIPGVKVEIEAVAGVRERA
jgi:2-iminobutanoate/2-iminopropanoate deaminase